MSEDKNININKPENKKYQGEKAYKLNVTPPETETRTLEGGDSEETVRSTNNLNKDGDNVNTNQPNNTPLCKEEEKANEGAAQAKDGGCEQWSQERTSQGDHTENDTHSKSAAAANTVGDLASQTTEEFKGQSSDCEQLKMNIGCDELPPNTDNNPANKTSQKGTVAKPASQLSQGDSGSQVGGKTADPCNTYSTDTENRPTENPSRDTDHVQTKNHSKVTHKVNSSCPNSESNDKSSVSAPEDSKSPDDNQSSNSTLKLEDIKINLETNDEKGDETNMADKQARKDDTNLKTDDNDKPKVERSVDTDSKEQSAKTTDKSSCKTDNENPETNEEIVKSKSKAQDEHHPDEKTKGSMPDSPVSPEGRKATKSDTDTNSKTTKTAANTDDSSKSDINRTKTAGNTDDSSKSLYANDGREGADAPAGAKNGGTPKKASRKGDRNLRPSDNLPPRLARIKRYWSDRDTQCYRDRYPGKQDYPDLTLNLEFYQGKIKSIPNGDFIDNIHAEWWTDYDLLERHHGYIQWLFPLRESGMNYHAQELQLHEAEAIKADKRAMERFVKSYEMMLNFYGIRLIDRETGEVERADNWKKRFEHLNYSMHNYLRITRILKCLGELGLERYKGFFLRFVLEEALRTGKLDRTLESCYNYWIGTVMDDTERESILRYAEDLCRRAEDSDDSDGGVCSHCVL